MKLDSVLTLAIGRNYGDNQPLSDRKWYNFQHKIVLTVSKYATVVAHTEGNGVASDDVRESQPEDSAVIVAINTTEQRKLRREIAKVIKHYGQSSCAFAIDAAHEPVFTTKDGYRS